MHDQLTANGFFVTTKGGPTSPVSISDTAGIDIILISATADANAIQGMFKDVPQPVIVSDPDLYDDMKMVVNGPYKAGYSLFTKYIYIADDTHPIANGFRDGYLKVTYWCSSISWGIPTASADVVATYGYSQMYPVIFSYDKGDQMNGMSAPGPRIGYFHGLSTPGYFRKNGWELFDNMFDHLMGTEEVRDSGDLIALYDFSDLSGGVLKDVSGYGTPLNLPISNPSYVSDEPCDGARFKYGTIAKSSGNPSKIINALKSTNEVTLEAWVSPERSRCGGYGSSNFYRIVSFSRNTGQRNFTLGHTNSGYGALVRTNDKWYGGSSNGYPMLQENHTVQMDQVQHVVYTLDDNGNEALYVDGVKVESGTRIGGLGNWSTNSKYKLAIGNEITNNRDFKGTMYMVAIYSKALTESEVQTNYAAGYCTLPEPGTRPGSAPVCEITDAGTISGGEFACSSPVYPADFVNTSLASGSGTINYFWMSSEDPDLPFSRWTIIPGADNKDYDPQSVSTTTYYVRCAQVEGCEDYYTSNVVSVIIDPTIESVAELDPNANFLLPDGSYSLDGGANALTVFADGTMTISGTIVNNFDPNKIWEINLTFQNRVRASQWESQGGSSYGSSSFQNTWDFYELDDINSQFLGQGSFSGKSLSLAVSVQDPNAGLQYGYEAGFQSEVMGLFGKFSVSGELSGDMQLTSTTVNEETYCAGEPALSAKVMLEGAFQPWTGKMKTTLNSQGILATSQPFWGYPWYYYGNDWVTEIPNDSIVDWVLVELRTSAYSGASYRQAAFVNHNGDIVDLDGFSPIELPVEDPSNYFLVIRSRNHLDVMSSTRLSTVGRTIVYDFTTGSDQARSVSYITNGPMKLLSNGQYAMYTGDSDASGVVNTSDFQWVIFRYYWSGYRSTDVDLSSVTTASDFQFVINNYFIYSHAPSN
ncbi:LamG domain-containing protein [Pontibacter sp. G13]|uniref:LamG domain-containing protein n=1 Tax=Pontibacter sp. G13 TaxID=3074898 RepID=UPI00288BA328|nr:LamG domain-containing protein [Pontibacter sp. G13]WNJ18594.1 LamG domain-containing protein [Pontibacter sp. G13]